MDSTSSTPRRQKKASGSRDKPEATPTRRSQRIIEREADKTKHAYPSQPEDPNPNTDPNPSPKSKSNPNPNPKPEEEKEKEEKENWAPFMRLLVEDEKRALKIMQDGIEFDKRIVEYYREGYLKPGVDHKKPVDVVSYENTYVGNGEVMLSSAAAAYCAAKEEDDFFSFAR